jgi:hypothetical protein
MLLRILCWLKSLNRKHLSKPLVCLGMSDSTDTKLAVHEAICTERMKFISDSLAKGSERMTKIEYLLYAVIVAVLLGPGAAASLFAKIFGL